MDQPSSPHSGMEGDRLVSPTAPVRCRGWAWDVDVFGKLSVMVVMIIIKTFPKLGPNFDRGGVLSASSLSLSLSLCPLLEESLLMLRKAKDT